MPYTEKERKLMRKLKKQYGAKKGEEIYYKMEKMALTKYKNLFGARTKAKIQKQKGSKKKKTKQVSKKRKKKTTKKKKKA